jgi:hypothetical protein
VIRRYYTVKGDAPYTGNETLAAVGGMAIATATSTTLTTVDSGTMTFTSSIVQPTSVSSSPVPTGARPAGTLSGTAAATSSKKGHHHHKSTQVSASSTATLGGVLIAGQSGGAISSSSIDSVASSRTCKRSRKRALKDFVGSV